MPRIVFNVFGITEFVDYRKKDIGFTRSNVADGLSQTPVTSSQTGCCVTEAYIICAGLVTSKSIPSSDYPRGGKDVTALWRCPVVPTVPRSPKKDHPVFSRSKGGHSSRPPHTTAAQASSRCRNRRPLVQFRRRVDGPHGGIKDRFSRLGKNDRVRWGCDLSRVGRG